MIKTLSLLFAVISLAPMARALENVRVIGPVAVSTQSSVSVTGSTAHDAAFSGDPVGVGVYASTPTTTPVANGDMVRLWGDPYGRLVVLPGHPYPQDPDTTNATAAGETVCISSPGANTSLYINKVTINNAGSANVTVSLLDGSGGTVRWKGELSSEGGSAGLSFGARGWKLTENVNLVVSLSGSGDVDVNVLEYYLGPSVP